MARETGFTLIEILVAISISVLLSAGLILYNRTGEQQIILFKDQAKIINLILRAKSLALQAYNVEGVSGCGYGVHFDPAGIIILFKDQATDCAGSDNIYSGPSEEIGRMTFTSKEKFSQLDFTDILYIPPDPKVVLTPALDDGLIIIGVFNGDSQVKIKVNSSGQVSQN